MNKRMEYIRKNWKLGIHLLLRTKRFGVNNERWSSFDSIFGLSFWKKLKSVLIYPLIDNYKQMKFRAGVCHFLSDESYELLFGRKKGEDIMKLKGKLKGCVIRGFKFKDGTLEGVLDITKSVYFRRINKMIRRIINKVLRFNKMIANLNKCIGKDK